MKLILTFLIGLVSTFTYADYDALLANIPVEFSKHELSRLSHSISFKMHVSSASKVVDSLSDWDQISASALSDTIVQVQIDGQAIFNKTHNNQMLQDSFVIDFNEASTQTFVSGFDRTQEISTHSLASYVDSYITQPTYIHSFYIASKAASEKSGDCTEYAVLTTSLSRSLNLPARFITGFVIFQQDDRLRAFGHAWTEVLLNKKWQIVDAALHGNDFKNLYYVPSAALNNEGPGYTLSLAEAISLYPTRLYDFKAL